MICQVDFFVALRKESVDRNADYVEYNYNNNKSLSARRAWIEIDLDDKFGGLVSVALRKESVDRNEGKLDADLWVLVALRKESVDRNHVRYAASTRPSSRSPQGERG